MSAYLKGKPNTAYKGRMDKHDDEFWLIWSNKWSCWYRPNSSGYTGNIAEAGIYTKDQARSHYSESEPKKYRDTEPFPVSAVRKHVSAAKSEMEARHSVERANIARIESALDGGASG